MHFIASFVYTINIIRPPIRVCEHTLIERDDNGALLSQATAMLYVNTGYRDSRSCILVLIIDK